MCASIKFELSCTVYLVIIIVLLAIQFCIYIGCYIATLLLMCICSYLHMISLFLINIKHTNNE